MTKDPEIGAELTRSEFAHAVVVALAGVAVHVTSNSPAVTAAFVARYDVAEASASDAPQCWLTVSVSPGGTLSAPDVEARWQFPDNDHATVSGPGFSAAIDLATFTATASADEAFVQRHPMFRRDLLEGIPLLLISRRDRHPVHAACVRQGNAALLLHGPSGVGKSTLAYAAHRAGLEVLTDDSTRVQLSPDLRIWGEGGEQSVHLLSHARKEFVELGHLEPDWLSAGGVAKLSVRLRTPVQEQLPYATVASVCLLSRNAESITRRPASAAEIRDALLNAAPGFDLAPEQLVRVADALTAPGGWHLKLSPDPTEALPHLREMIALVRGS